MNSPLVSVIVPTYNYGKYLERCVDSILKQTVIDDIEIIIVDDCSTDNTTDIAIICMMKSSNVIYYRQEENVGQAANRNSGIKMARGKYVAFIDADDWVEPDYLETMLPGFEDPEVGVTYCTSKICWKGGCSIPNRKTRSGYLTKELYVKNLTGTLIMVRRELLGKGYETNLIPELGNMGADWWMVLKLSTKCKFRGYDKPNYNRWVHDSQISNFKRNGEARIQSDEAIRTRFYSEYSEFLDKNSIRKANARMFFARGALQRKNGNWMAACSNYLKSWIRSPLNFETYRQIVACFLAATVGLPTR